MTTEPINHPAYSAAGLRFLVEDQQSIAARWARDRIAALEARLIEIGLDRKT